MPRCRHLVPLVQYTQLAVQLSVCKAGGLDLELFQENQISPRASSLTIP